MIPMMKGDRPLFYTFHRAWGACVGLPQYNKKAWQAIEPMVLQAEEAGSQKRIEAALLVVEALLTQQGGCYK